MSLESSTDKMRDPAAPARGEDGGIPRVDPQAMPGGLNIGTRLRHARLSRDMRLKDVAEAAGCSESLISKLENDRLRPSLNILYRICEALGLTFGELFATPEPTRQLVVRAGERVAVELNHVRRGQGIRLERLIPYSKGHLLQGNVHIVAPDGGSEGLITHQGEEIAYVVQGEIELLLADEVYRLGPGDACCYRSEVPHGYRNAGPVEAHVIFINTPPSF